MDSPKQWTAGQLVMLAARGLPELFSIWDLVVEAWKLWPDRFGIPGYDYPNSTRVKVEVMNRSAPIKRQKWLEPAGQNRYRFTAAGRTEAARLVGLHGPPIAAKRPPSKVHAERDAFRNLLIRVRIAISTVRTAEEERQGLSLLMHDVRAALGEKEYAGEKV
jgi:hypothetical protein